MKVEAVPYTRGDILMDTWRLYVVLDVVYLAKVKFYDTLILAILCESSYREYAGQFRHWGDSVEFDTYLGKVELPATL